MIFPVLELDKKIQAGEVLRISAVKSFLTVGEGAVTAVKIKPGAAESFYTIGATTEVMTWFLDWAFDVAGTYDVTLRIETASNFKEVTKQIEVITEATDALFSTDVDLLGYQHDIMKYLADGKSSWNFCHRVAQQEILSYFDEIGLVNEDGTKIGKEQVVDITEVKNLSIFKTLRIIFESMSNAPDDFFIKRAEHWNKYEKQAQLRCVNRLDFNKSGSLDDNEVSSNLNISVARG